MAPRPEKKKSRWPERWTDDYETRQHTYGIVTVVRVSALGPYRLKDIEPAKTERVYLEHKEREWIALADIKRHVEENYAILCVRVPPTEGEFLDDTEDY